MVHLGLDDSHIFTVLAGTDSVASENAGRMLFPKQMPLHDTHSAENGLNQSRQMGLGVSRRDNFAQMNNAACKSEETLVDRNRSIGLRSGLFRSTRVIDKGNTYGCAQA